MAKTTKKSAEQSEKAEKPVKKAATAKAKTEKAVKEAKPELTFNRQNLQW